MNFLDEIKKIANGEADGGAFDIEPLKVPQNIPFQQFARPKLTPDPEPEPQIIAPVVDMGKIKTRATMNTNRFFYLINGMKIGSNVLIANLIFTKADKLAIKAHKRGEPIEREEIEKAVSNKAKRDDILKGKTEITDKEFRTMYFDAEVERLIKKWNAGKFEQPSQFELLLHGLSLAVIEPLQEHQKLISERFFG